MKLLSIARSKAIWLFPTNDLNPKGAFNGDLLDSLRSRYNFQVVPTPAQLFEFDTKKQAVQLAMGSFKSTDGEVGVSLTYYTDGLIAETRGTTARADEFLADVLAWVHDEYGYAEPSSLKMRKVYSSELHVSLQDTLSLINPALDNIAGAYGTRAKWSGQSNRFEVTGISFGSDPASKAQVPPFRLERDINAPFDEQRYYSVAPLQTADHLQILGQVESLLHL